MNKATCFAIVAFFTIPVAASAADTHAPSPPKIFEALKGCWHGDGSVLGKRVGIALRAEPILLGTMFAVDADSSAVANPSDRYQAHLLFGGSSSGNNAVRGFWSDSFGAGFTANGEGTASIDGFEVAYRYPDMVYVNRWRVQNDNLNWSIVSKSKDAKEKPFATYELKRTQCSGGAVVQ